MLTAQLAAEIVSETMQRAHYNINIMDRSGTIIASGTPARIGQYHAAAAEAVRLDRMLVIDNVNAAQYEGAQPGVNVPVHFQDHVIGVIGITGDPAEVAPLAQLVKMTTELMVRQNQLKLQDEWRRFTVDLIVEELLQQSPAAQSVTAERLDALRIAFHSPYQVAVVSYRLPAAHRATEGLLQKVSQVIGEGRALISAFRPQKLVLIFYRTSEATAADRLRTLAEWMNDEGMTCRIAVGSLVAGREQLPLAYEEAELAHQFGGNGPADDDESYPQIVHFNTVQARALVHTIPKEHQARLLMKFDALSDAKLRETLEHYFRADLNVAAASASLGIHRNTMLYRLEQIRERLGCDPARFEQALLLQLALWLHRSSESS